MAIKAPSFIEYDEEEREEIDEGLAEDREELGAGPVAGRRALGIASALQTGVELALADDPTGASVREPGRWFSLAVAALCMGEAFDQPVQLQLPDGRFAEVTPGTARPPTYLIARGLAVAWLVRDFEALQHYLDAMPRIAPAASDVPELAPYMGALHGFARSVMSDGEDRPDVGLLVAAVVTSERDSPAVQQWLRPDMRVLAAIMNEDADALDTALTGAIEAYRRYFADKGTDCPVSLTLMGLAARAAANGLPVLDVPSWLPGAAFRGKWAS